MENNLSGSFKINHLYKAMQHIFPSVNFIHASTFKLVLPVGI